MQAVSSIGPAFSCAFDTENGTFTSDNWMCATMGEIREFVEETAVYNDDQNAAIVPFDEGDYLIVSWYKRRGRTEGLWVLDEESIRPANLEDAEKAVEMFDTRRRTRKAREVCSTKGHNWAPTSTLHGNDQRMWECERCGGRRMSHKGVPPTQRLT